MDIIEAVKKEQNCLKLKIKLCQEDFSKQFAKLTTEQRCAFFRELGIDRSMSKWLFPTMLYAIASSLKFEWEDKDNACEFFDFLFRIPTSFSKGFNSWCTRMEVNEANLEFLYKVLKSSILSEVDKKWVVFIVSCYSTSQLEGMPDNVKENAKFKFALHYRNQCMPKVES